VSLISILFIILCVVILLGALASLLFKDLLASVVTFAVISLLLTIVFFLLDAPDVAIAEASIGAALTTVIFVISVKLTRRREE
jgi:multicomponent Na+:H+ antiporter subunit A